MTKKCINLFDKYDSFGNLNYGIFPFLGTQPQDLVSYWWSNKPMTVHMDVAFRFYYLSQEGIR